MATTSDSAKATWAVASLPSSVTYVLSADVFACAIAVVTTVIRCSSMGRPRGGPPVRPAARRATDVPPETRARRGACQDAPSIDLGTWSIRPIPQPSRHVAAVGRSSGSWDLAAPVAYLRARTPRAG